MNEWLVAAAVLLVAGIGPCGYVCATASAIEGLVALELAGVLAALALLMLAQGLERQPFADLALVLAVLSFVGTLGFVRFMEREV
jgi:multicomponent Na+:H+ antiporter subunit F